MNLDQTDVNWAFGVAAVVALSDANITNKSTICGTVSYSL